MSDVFNCFNRQLKLLPLLGSQGDSSRHKLRCEQFLRHRSRFRRCFSYLKKKERDDYYIRS